MLKTLNSFFSQERKPVSAGMVCMLVVGFLVIDAMFGTSHAQNQVFSDLTTKGTDFFYNARKVILILSCIALMVTMAGAVTGRFPTQKAIVIVLAVVVIAGTSSIVTYFASPAETTATTGIPSLTDTSTQ